MNNYWDSFDCQVQCEEVYTEETYPVEATDSGNRTEKKPAQAGC